MKLTRSVHFNPALFGVIPFVNVIFLLLVFFAISRSFVLEPGIAVTLPISSFTLAPQLKPQIVSIASDPVPAIFFRDQKMSFEAFVKSLANNRAKDTTLIVRADRATQYDLIMRVMNSALGAGYNVVLATAPEQK
jgi:biopolymer transport protein ExbD